MSNYLDRPTKKVYFKSDPELFAELYAEMNWGDAKAFRDNEENDANLFQMIKEWNVPGLDLTYDNLKQLKRIDINELFRVFDEIVEAEAKALQATDSKKKTK